MPIQTIARSLFCLSLVVATFMALVPGPIGQIIESGPERHFLAFLMLPIFAGLGWPRISYRRLWLAFAAFGGLIELAQLVMAIGRSGRFIDWVIDCVAITVSLLILYHIRQLMDQHET